MGEERADVSVGMEDEFLCFVFEVYVSDSPIVVPLHYEDVVFLWADYEETFIEIDCL